MEYIHQKDFDLGLSVFLPLMTAQRLFRQAGLPLNGTSTHLVDGGPYKPEGRLTINATLSGLNHPDKQCVLSHFNHGTLHMTLPCHSTLYMTHSSHSTLHMTHHS